MITIVKKKTETKTIHEPEIITTACPKKKDATKDLAIITTGIEPEIERSINESFQKQEKENAVNDIMFELAEDDMFFARRMLAEKAVWMMHSMGGECICPNCCSFDGVQYLLVRREYICSECGINVEDWLADPEHINDLYAYIEESGINPVEELKSIL